MGCGSSKSILVDLDRYIGPDSVWAALSSGSVRLLRMSWLIDLSKAGKTLCRRQELPEKAFITIEELQDLFGDGNGDHVLPIIAISSVWLTKVHPDPNGEVLATVVDHMIRARSKYADIFPEGEMGVFWDWVRMAALGAMQVQQTLTYCCAACPGEPLPKGARWQFLVGGRDGRVSYRAARHDGLVVCAPRDYHLDAHRAAGKRDARDRLQRVGLGYV